MAIAIKHRGPDHTGLLMEDPVGLAMNRLSIIDLTGGNQPMHSVDRRYSLIFNGEIYNFRELRSQLTEKYEFQTNSDTEVILHGYHAWGKRVFEKLNGMFSVAIWDREAESLLLARDAVGIKPLFYSIQQGAFYFSSELKSFTETGLIRQVNWSAVYSFLSAGYVFRPQTALDGVLQIEPGTILEVRKDMSFQEHRFRCLGVAPEENVEHETQRSIVSQVRTAIGDAVERQTVADVPFGLLLSSGIDSMTILAALKERGLTEGLNTFTVFYGDSSFSENRVVGQLAKEWGLKNHELELTSAQIESHLPQIFNSFDNLELLPTSLAIYEVSHLASQTCKVLLAGNGGDELFMGYPTYKATNLIQNAPILGLVAPLFRRLVNRLSTNDAYLSLAEKLQRFVAVADSDAVASHLRWRHVFAYHDLGQVFKEPSFLPTSDEIYASQYAFFSQAKSSGFDSRDLLMMGDLHTWLVDCGLMMWDKAGMSASAEIRVPLLDNDLLDFLIRIPHKIRVPKIGTKSFLKELYSDILPDYVTQQPKRGFQAPIALWLRGGLGRTFRDLTEALPGDIFNQKYIERLWMEFNSQRGDHSLRLWSLGCLAGWAKCHAIDLTNPSEVRV